ncbi:MAG: NUDIX domain-containing protein [Candidatus Atribacteria bacterium]|nr:NUDIX domain-containing protein [Candidatus Atribacteria bacterium]
MPTVEIKACGGIILKNSAEGCQILLIRKRNASIWTFPKGHKEPNESDDCTALREVEEETGITCELVEKVGEIGFSYLKKGNEHHETVTFFLMKPIVENPIHDTGEIEETRWFLLSAAEQVLFFETDKEILGRVVTLNSRHFLEDGHFKI